MGRGNADLSGAAGLAAAARLGVRLSSPDRLAYPDPPVSKAQVAAYYALVAPPLLALSAGRPLSLVRCPDGIAGAHFFQKHDRGHFPTAIGSLAIAEREGDRERYFVLSDAASILACVQMNVLEFHLWGAMGADLERPERLVFDLDPDDGLAFAEVLAAARRVRAALAGHGLTSFALLTGGRGIHVVAPLVPGAGWAAARAFCGDVAAALVAGADGRLTTALARDKRKGRIFVDILRNARGATAIAPYSTRARPGAPVAAPVGWDELDRLGTAAAFTIPAMPARVAGPDPWAGYAAARRPLPG